MFVEIENYEEINGGGVFGAIGGAMIGATYGVAIGAYAWSKTGQIKDVYKSAWAGAMFGGACGAFIPGP